MKLVIQRVSHADVKVGNEVVGAIGRGLMILVGIDVDDSEADVDRLVSKTSSMRIFPDMKGVMNLSVTDVGGEVLAVSQFTLLASTKKGNRPSYIRAARPEKAVPLYERFCDSLSEKIGRPVAKGRFGADMQVTLTNDGPVTIVIDSRDDRMPTEPVNSGRT